MHGTHGEGLRVNLSKRKDQMCETGGIDLTDWDFVAISTPSVPVSLEQHSQNPEPEFLLTSLRSTQSCA